MWAFMKALCFDNFKNDFIQFEIPLIGEGQPQRFIPVFEDYDDVVQFADDDVELVVELYVRDKVKEDKNVSKE